MNAISADGPRVLVIDPIEETSQLIDLILKRAGDCSVIRSPSPARAMPIVVSGQVDLVLLEAFYPNEASLTFCRDLKADEELQHLPVILFSSEHDKQTMLRGFDAGCVDYLFKPLFPMELAARVRTHFQLKRQKDITMRRMIEQQELLQVMCHDVTGPVGAARSLLEMCLENPALFQEAAPDIIQALGKVIDLTDLVRKMRSFEDGKMAWTLGPLNLAKAVEEALSIVRNRLKDKEISVDVTIPEDLSVDVEPVSFINSVLANLLTNAIKFSHRGATIQIVATADASVVAFVVQDEGIGMPPEILKNLFNVHVPTSRPGTGREPGTGYGMPLVKKFVEAYGGGLKILSKDIEEYPEAHGTRVEIRLKAAVPVLA